MMRPQDVPVLMLVFNRPDKTRAVFEQVRRLRPTRLFVAADGPRPDRPEDVERCEQTRAVFDAVDWPCTVETLYRDVNLGCKAGVESGITWFFSAVEAGIVLEDDCIPAPSFFPYCADLLERYRDTDDVMMITGTNMLGEWKADRQSYHLCRTPTIWGWATWRRAWQHYDPALSAWRDPAARARVRDLLGPDQYRWWRTRLDSVAAGRVDTWDWPWALAVMLERGTTATPARNLITNIGFDAEATHTRNEWSETAGLPAADLTFPLRLPATHEADREYDRAVHEQGRTLYSRLADRLPPVVQEPARVAFHRLTALVPRRSEAPTR